jgi:hypothetical protein
MLIPIDELEQYLFTVFLSEIRRCRRVPSPFDCACMLTEVGTVRPNGVAGWGPGGPGLGCARAHPDPPVGPPLGRCHLTQGHGRGRAT